MKARNEAQPKAEARSSQDAALRLLQYEAEIRRQSTVEELQHHMVNRVSTLLPCAQIVLWLRPRIDAALEPLRISHITDVDTGTPLLLAMQDWLQLADSQRQLTAPLLMDLGSPGAALSEPSREVLSHYPLRHAAWVPLSLANEVTEGGLLCLRDTPFREGEQALLARLCDTYAHAWHALLPRRRASLTAPRKITRRAIAYGLVLLLALGMVPVRQSVIAPMEVVAASPAVVTAPFSGVIRRIVPDASQAVLVGDTLVEFEDIELRNEATLAQQKLAVSQARLARLAAVAFTDESARHELAIAKAEYELARLDQQHADDLLKRSVIQASKPGVVIYADRRDVEGRAIQVGEEILQVADPRSIRLRIHLPVADKLDFPPDAEVMAHFDQASIGGAQARLKSISYIPAMTPAGVTAYTVQADFVEAPRGLAIGTRGTAELYSEQVPLFIQLFRRPLNAARQFFGI